MGESGKQCRQCAMRPLTAHVENGDRSRTSRLFARLSAFRSCLCCRILLGWWCGRKVSRLACGQALDLKPHLAHVFPPLALLSLLYLWFISEGRRVGKECFSRGNF